MRTSHKTHPRLEDIEARTLLSGAGGAAVATGIVSPPTVHVVHLDGTIKGGYTEAQSNPDIPQVTTLFGSGQVGAEGHTSLAGSLEQGGFTSNPVAHGTIYLATADGTITLLLKADPKGGHTGGLPTQFDYTIVGGTGAYKEETGHGTAVLTLDPAVTTGTTTTADPGSTTHHGTFNMVFVG